MPRRLDPNRERRPNRKTPPGRNGIKKRLPDLFDGTDDDLTIKERLWVLHYNANGGNGAQAARDAGYAVGKPDGPRKDHAADLSKHIKRRPDVRAALEALQASTTRELGDMALALRIRTAEVMLSDAKDRMAAARLLAEMTPGALVPKQVQVESKTFPELVLAAQRKRESTAEALPVNPEPDPAEPQKPE